MAAMPAALRKGSDWSRCMRSVSACAPTFCDASLISNADAAITTVPSVFVLSISALLN